MMHLDTTDLADALRVLGEHGDRLALFATAPDQLDEILTDLDQARRLLLAARAALGPSGCRFHPAVPVDPAAGGACLICAQHQRAGQLAEQAGALEAASVADICAAVAAEGWPAAEARYGPQAVARAVLLCRKDTDLRDSK
jgi:hypothetical protein